VSVGGRSLLARAAALAAGAVLAACSDVPEGGDSATVSTLERARAAGTIRVGYANEAPYAYLDSASGRLTGEAPEIARVVLGDLGIDEVEGVLTEFGALIPGLQAKRFDIIAAGMYILPKRCEQIAFSNPTYAIGEAFIVRKGNPLGLHGYDDAAGHPQARIGVVAGAVERSYAQAMGVPDERIVLFPTPASALAGVEAGRVDAYAATSLTANDLLRKAGSGKVELARPFRDPVIDGKPARGYGAFGFRKEDAGLKAAFDAALAKFIGSPAHLELVRPFGFTERELPGEATAAALCGH
jgi:polar amino acid transport system substrate-binding protein